MATGRRSLVRANRKWIVFGLALMFILVSACYVITDVAGTLYVVDPASASGVNSAELLRRIGLSIQLYVLAVITNIGAAIFAVAVTYALFSRRTQRQNIIQSIESALVKIDKKRLQQTAEETATPQNNTDAAAQQAIFEALNLLVWGAPREKVDVEHLRRKINRLKQTGMLSQEHYMVLTKGLEN